MTPHDNIWVVGYFNFYLIQQITSRREKANRMQQIEREELERER